MAMCPRAFSKFSKLPSSLPDSGNFVKTLKMRVKLILNCPRAHAITYTYQLRKFRLQDLVKSIELEGNCSNPTAINACKRRRMTCCHLCMCSRFGLSSSPNHRLSCVIIDQSPYRKFITPTDTTCGPTLVSGILYTYARTTMMPPPEAKTLRGQ